MSVLNNTTQEIMIDRFYYLPAYNKCTLEKIMGHVVLINFMWEGT